MGRVQDKVALVTGASLGLGRASAVLMAREGAKVVLTDIREAEGQALAAELVAEGQEALFLRHDVSSEADWDRVMAAALDRFGRMDVVVNNAGVALAASVEDTTLEQWRWLMGINLDGVFLGVRAGVKAMRDHGGSIINLSSIEGIVGHPGYAAYSAGKGAVRNLTKSAALHAGRSGYKVRVNSIHPGYIKTPMVGDDPEELARLTKLHPIGFLGEPVDIANMALFLASYPSAALTGQSFVVSHGWYMQ